VVRTTRLIYAAGLALGVLFVITGWGVWGILSMIVLITAPWPGEADEHRSAQRDHDTLRGRFRRPG